MPARANLSGCLRSCCWSTEPLFGEAACFSWRSHHSRSLDFAVLTLDGALRRPWAAALAIAAGLFWCVRWTTAVDGLANCHHRLLQLVERRLHRFEVVGIERTLYG